MALDEQLTYISSEFNEVNWNRIHPPTRRQDGGHYAYENVDFQYIFSFSIWKSYVRVVRHSDEQIDPILHNCGTVGPRKSDRPMRTSYMDI